MPISGADPLLSVRGLRSGYGKIVVLHGVDLTIAPGEVVALLGPNGAGKTTLLRTVSGLLPWSAGEVKFAGSDLRSVGARETMRPRASAKTRSANVSAFAINCSTNRIAVPLSRSCRATARTRSTSTGESPADGSSSISRSGRRTSPCATASICC